ncbi:MAG: hypothetical protein PVF96_05460 [Candidatus Bathyarchaeota archaeon]
MLETRVQVTRTTQSRLMSTQKDRNIGSLLTKQKRTGVSLRAEFGRSKGILILEQPYYQRFQSLPTNILDK